MSILEISKKYSENVVAIDQISNIGSDVSEILLGFLEALKKENEKISGFALYKEKIDRVIQQIQSIKSHPVLKTKYEVMYNQAIVLLVSNLEASLIDLVVKLVDEYHEIIRWPKEDKKIVFEVGTLNYKFPSLGELVVESLSNEFNFQDLQSTLRFFKDYLGIDLNLENILKDTLIKYQALRHVIIHSFSKIDESFLKQMRNTALAKRYAINERVKLKESDYIEAKDAFLKLISGLIDGIHSKIKDKYGEEYFSSVESE